MDRCCGVTLTTSIARYAPPIPSLNYTGGYSLGNSARIATDDNSWLGVLSAANVMAALSQYARPGYWNDPDLLLSVDFGGRLRMSELQSRAQFALWSVLSAPLLISGSLSTMSAHTLATYSNQAAIAINQDGGVQGSRLVGSNLVACAGKNVSNCTNVWGKTTSASAADAPAASGNGGSVAAAPSSAPAPAPSARTWAVLLLNAGSAPAAIGCNSTCLGLLGITEASLPLAVTEAWGGVPSATTLTKLDLPPVTLLPAGGHQLLQLQQSH